MPRLLSLPKRLANYSQSDAKEVVDCLIFLGYSEEAVKQPNSIIGSFSDLLEAKLTLEPHERDVVLMHHDIIGDFGDREEYHTSTMTCYGTEEMTAMCKTVGYTAAVGTEMVLDGTIPENGVVVPMKKHIYEVSIDSYSPRRPLFSAL